MISLQPLQNSWGKCEQREVLSLICTSSCSESDIEFAFFVDLRVELSRVIEFASRVDRETECDLQEAQRDYCRGLRP